MGQDHWYDMSSEKERDHYAYLLSHNDNVHCLQCEIRDSRLAMK